MPGHARTASPAKVDGKPVQGLASGGVQGRGLGEAARPRQPV